MVAPPVSPRRRQRQARTLAPAQGQTGITAGASNPVLVVGSPASAVKDDRGIIFARDSVPTSPAHGPQSHVTSPDTVADTSAE